MKVKKKKCSKNQMFHLYAPGLPAYTLQVQQLQDKHTMILPCSEGILAAIRSDFIKRRTNCPELDIVRSWTCVHYS